MATAEPQGVASSCPTAAAFSPAKAMVEVRDVELGALSKFLRKGHDYFPELITEDQSRILADHSAKLLVAPMGASLIRYTSKSSQNMAKVMGLLKNGGIERQELLKIIHTNLGTFNDDMSTIRNIDEAYGIHHNGQFLKGAHVSDRSNNAPDGTFEKNWAKHVISVFKNAVAHNCSYTSGLAIGTKEMFCGPDVGSNISLNISAINMALNEQGAQKIITSNDSDFKWNHLQHTCTQGDDGHCFVLRVNLSRRHAISVNRKTTDPSSCRAFALQIDPLPSMS